MSSTGRHASSPALWLPTRLGVTTAVAGLLAVTVVIGGVGAESAGPGAAAAGAESSAGRGPASAARSTASRALPATAGPAAVSVNAAPVARANAVPAVTRLTPPAG